MRSFITSSSFVAALCLTVAVGCATDPGSDKAPPTGGSGSGSDTGTGSGSDPNPTPDPTPTGAGLSGSWTGSFTTDNALASKGNFTFNLTEDPTDTANTVNGPFTGTVTSGASGTAFKGTFSGTRTGTVLNGKVTVTDPPGITGDFGFDNATISGPGDGNMIAGSFNINVSYSGIPLTAKGSYTISR